MIPLAIWLNDIAKIFQTCLQGFQMIWEKNFDLFHQVLMNTKMKKGVFLLIGFHAQGKTKMFNNVMIQLSNFKREKRKN